MAYTTGDTDDQGRTSTAKNMLGKGQNAMNDAARKGWDRTFLKQPAICKSCWAWSRVLGRCRYHADATLCQEEDYEETHRFADEYGADDD